MASKMNKTSYSDLWSYTPDPELLGGRTVAITGAANGLGRATALAAASLGATVVLMDKSVGRLEHVYDEITGASGPEPAIIPIDLAGATREDYETIGQTLEQNFGSLDGLVNNAGWLGSYTPFPHYDMKLYQEVMTINLHAPFMLTQALLPLLQAAPDPSVVFSTHNHDVAYAGAFGIAKGGLKSMMRILADEFETENPIRFNGVDAGIVDTQMRRLNFPGEDWSQHPKPEEVVAPYLYFLGPESRGVTGVNCVRTGNE